jgi:hypothetical protein
MLGIYSLFSFNDVFDYEEHWLGDYVEHLLCAHVFAMSLHQNGPCLEGKPCPKLIVLDKVSLWGMLESVRILCTNCSYTNYNSRTKSN